MTCQRYYLDHGQLVYTEEPGRCERYWLLWTRRNRATAALAENQLHEGLRETLADAETTLESHLEHCPTCRAWLQACEESSKPISNPEDIKHEPAS